MKKIIVMIGLSLSLVACGVVSATGSVVGGTIKAQVCQFKLQFYLNIFLISIFI